MPGDIFYENTEDNIPRDKNSLKGNDTFRIGFGRVSDEDIKNGIKIIGDNIKYLKKNQNT